MDPSLSMNAVSGHIDLNEMERRAKVAAMFKDRPLVDVLCARLAGYCGEGGRNESVVGTLDRLISEVRAARQGPTSPPPQDGPRSAMLGHVQQLRAPGQMFSRTEILAILKAHKCLNDSHTIPTMREGGDDVLRSLIRIFENLE